MFSKNILLSALTGILLSGCGSSSTSSFQTPASTTTAVNEGVVSQNNLILLFSETAPQFVDLATNPGSASFADVESQISVRIGDVNNQLVTGQRTVFFKTEWGILSSDCSINNVTCCITADDGTCSITWKSGSPDDMPADFLNNIVAYLENGQEAFTDVNGNGFFDDSDSFIDLEEPYIDVNQDGTFTTGVDIVIDTVNGVDPSGINASHDPADGLFNGPKCIHSTLCSPDFDSVTIWSSGSLRLSGGDTFTVGGSVSGLAGSVILTNARNGTTSETLTVTADGDFTFSNGLFPGDTYSVTSANSSTGQTCTVSNGSGVILQNVTDVTVTCN